MYDIGAKKAFKCNAGYNETSGKSLSICQPNGRWDFVPHCELISGKYL